MSADLEARLESVARAIGVSELKDEQRKVALSFVRGNGVFVSLLMGYGKSVVSLEKKTVVMFSLQRAPVLCATRRFATGLASYCHRSPTAHTRSSTREANNNIHSCLLRHNI